MTCDTIRGRLTALLDGELPPETQSEMERHLASCAGCAQSWAELQAIRGLADGWPLDAPDIAVRVMEAIALDDESLLLDEMRGLRAELEALRAEVAALRRQLSRPIASSAWFPSAKPDYPRLENDPWNSIRS